AASTEIEIPEESGRSKRKRVPRKLADALNGCLCGQVLESSLNGVLECKQAGCETQWYHLQCVELKLEPGNWVCVACEASGRGPRGWRNRTFIYTVGISVSAWNSPPSFYIW
ncbi:hypothetical protein L208DRAFT_1337500, partial [Tricholoma matsutake]